MSVATYHRMNQPSPESPHPGSEAVRVAAADISSIGDVSLQGALAQQLRYEQEVHPSTLVVCANTDDSLSHTWTVRKVPLSLAPYPK